MRRAIVIIGSRVEYDEMGSPLPGTPDGRLRLALKRMLRNYGIRVEDILDENAADEAVDACKRIRQARVVS